MDEKGVLIGYSVKAKAICRAQRRNPKVIQDGAREMLMHGCLWGWNSYARYSYGAGGLQPGSRLILVLVKARCMVVGS